MADEFLVLVVRNGAGQFRELGELVDAGSDEWALRVTDPLTLAAVDSLEALVAAVRDRLPAAGAATEATLGSVLTSVDGLEALVAAVRDRLPAAGAATEATLGSVLTSVDGLEGTLATVLAAVDTLETLTSAQATEATLGSVLAAVDTLETLIAAVRDRLPAAGAASEATLAGLSSRFARLLKFEPTAGEEIRRDETTTDDYHGAAPDNTSTATASWDVVRFYKDASGNITRVRFRTGVAWDARAAGW